jgi:hypothetical protein
MGPDGVAPLTLTRTSDVVITSAPSAGDVSVVSIYRMGGCGVLAQELACANSSTMGGGATLRASSLPAGVYYVQVAAVRGAATTVTATVSPARPRTNGDVCPGVTVRPDMGPVIQSTMGYQATNDYGTTCASGSGGGPSTSSHDAVFTFTTTEARDVTIEVSATGGTIVSMELTRTCGERATALTGCINGNPASRTFRNLAAGTYFITVAANAQRTLIANVTTSIPVPPPVGDTCPGVALSAGSAGTISLPGLTPGITTLACAPAHVGDGAFAFTAPAIGNDVLVNVTTSSGRFGVQLQRPCGGTNVGACVGANDGTRSIWQRYTGLSAAQPHAIVVGTNAASGTMTARYLTVPTPSTTMVGNNFSCMNPQVIRAPGGIFRGSNSVSGTRTGSTMALRPGCIPIGCLGGRAVFYRLELTTPQRVIATATGFDTTLWIATGTNCPGTTNPMACNDDRLGMAAQIDVTLNAGTYWLVLSGCGPMAEGTYTLDVATVAP